MTSFITIFTERVFDQFPKYHVKILLGGFNTRKT